ncbi:hypothetical protein PENSUB_114 [Penicillium subrubescens]|uniref:Uncharacterized protein n=1 Tax=Penicillium subrubescens TaxID=1316194 RepID=A0A1Q5UP00_9EURO|nr:hypothetical protein PENSUB_114 [Penicillium subrubescens]
MQYSVVKLLSFLLPSPVAYIIASVLLAETYFFWTARTILPRDQVRLVPEPRDRQRWKALVVPTLIYAVTITAMTYVPALFENSLAPPEDVTIPANIACVVTSHKDSSETTCAFNEAIKNKKKKKKTSREEIA